MRMLLKYHPDCQIQDIQLLVEQEASWVHIGSCDKNACAARSLGLEIHSY